MSFKKSLLAAAMIVTLPTLAMANDGLYLGLGAGVDFGRDKDVSGSGLKIDTDYDTGWVGLVTLGNAYSNGFRTELELGYRGRDVDTKNGANKGGGDANMWTGMINGLYDFRNSTGFVPYLGLGIGAARVQIDADTTTTNARVTGSDTAFAAQGIVGLGYKLNEQAQLFADYRYLRAFDADFKSNASKVNGDVDTQSVMVGLRWYFNPPKKAMAEPAKPAAAPAPAPAPMAAPAPAPKLATPGPYLVFFDFDKADLTTQAKQIIQTAAENKNKAQVTRIEVTGHADRSGTDKYNMRLSEKRAQAVKAELKRLGVKDAEIVTYAKGESQPLVATADGVKEPQNRRVEIVLK